MAGIMEVLQTTLPDWLEIVESDDGQYHVMDSSFDDGAMELARFQIPDRAMQFAMRLAQRRTGLPQGRPVWTEEYFGRPRHTLSRRPV
jgi:hypothetical protein